MGAELLVLGRVLLSLVIVLALAVLIIRFGLPKLTGLKLNAQSEIQIDEVRSLDRQHKVALVAVAGEKILLGFGGGSVNRLASWPEDDGPDELAEPLRAVELEEAQG